ncbi:MAG: hypothetical protein MHM6MM_000591 [Cercozoa sp. M6MM]
MDGVHESPTLLSTLNMRLASRRSSFQVDDASGDNETSSTSPTSESQDDGGPSARTALLNADLVAHVLNFACEKVAETAEMAYVHPVWRQAVQHKSEDMWRRFAVQKWPALQSRSNVNWFSLVACDFASFHSQPGWENSARFRFQCPLRVGGALMRRTDQDNVDHCLVCRKNVHIVKSRDELEQHASDGECVRFVLNESGEILTERNTRGRTRLMMGMMMASTYNPLLRYGVEALRLPLSNHALYWPLSDVFGKRGTKLYEQDNKLVQLVQHIVSSSLSVSLEERHVVLPVPRALAETEAEQFLMTMFESYGLQGLSLIPDVVCVTEGQPSIAVQLGATHITVTAVMPSCDFTCDGDDIKVSNTSVHTLVKVESALCANDLVEFLRRRARVAVGDNGKEALKTVSVAREEPSEVSRALSKMVEVAATSHEFDHRMQLSVPEQVRRYTLDVFGGTNPNVDPNIVGAKVELPRKESVFAGEALFAPLLKSTPVQTLVRRVLENVCLEGALAQATGVTERLQYELSSLGYDNVAVRNKGVNGVALGASKLCYNVEQHGGVCGVLEEYDEVGPYGDFRARYTQFWH